MEIENVSEWPVMIRKCKTCPFKRDETGVEQCQEIADMVRARCMTSASQICHHPRLHGKRENSLCRGARDHQLQMFYRMGVISAPTDEAWDLARRNLK